MTRFRQILRDCPFAKLLGAVGRGCGWAARIAPLLLASLVAAQAPPPELSQVEAQPLPFRAPQRLPAGSQIEPLPPVEPEVVAPPTLLEPGALPPGTIVEEGFPLPLVEEDPLATQKLTTYKESFFQKASLSGSWLGQGDDPADLGITEIEIFLQTAIPFPIRQWPLLITPGYNMYLLADNGVTDLPPRLHTAYLDLTWVPTIVQGHQILLNVAPSVYSDFQARDDHAFRVTGKAFYVWDPMPDRLRVIAGLLYLNRDDITILPAGGVIWNPTDYVSYELIFPKPKLNFRLNQGPGFEDWVFFTAEFGGNTWSVTRESGAHDYLTWIDYRVLLGYERRLNGGAGYRFEAGYVFGRSVEFSSGIGDYDPEDTIMLRGGIVF